MERCEIPTHSNYNFPLDYSTTQSQRMKYNLKGSESFRDVVQHYLLPHSYTTPSHVLGNMHLILLAALL